MRTVILAVMITSLAGCAMGHRDPVEIKQALNEAINESNSRQLQQLPAAVEADLMPEFIDRTSHASIDTMRFRVQANQVDASAFFTSLVKGSEYSVAIHPAVSGQITLSLTNVTLDEVLAVVRDLYGFEVEKVGRVLQVYPAGLRTVTIPVDYLQFQRSGRSITSISTGTVTSPNAASNSEGGSSSRGGTEIETTSESDFWRQLETTVSRLIGSDAGQSVMVTPQASVITVRAYPDEIREVRQFLDISHLRIQRQVILEAKILEVTLNDGYQQGINWSKTFSSNGTEFQLGQGVIPAPVPRLPGMDAIGTLLGGQTNLVIQSGSFDAVLNFMATQGDLNVLSSPRVTAANNQKAVIKVGTDEYYVTDLTSEVGTGDNANVAPNIQLTPFFSGISLDVTPQIDDSGYVFLHVHPSVIEVDEQRKSIQFNDRTITLPLARSSIRESDSVIRAQDGDVVVIGGLMKSQTTNQTSKVPFFGDIPLLGHLFRHSANVSQKTELVILLKPTVVGVNTWQRELERSRNLLQEWFPDSQ